MRECRRRRGSSIQRAARPLRFLHLTTFYPPYSFGGDALYVQRLAGLLADAGHEVDVVHCVDSYRALSRLPPARAVEQRPNLRVHSLRSGYGALSPLFSYLTGRPLLQRARVQAIVDRAQPDVIHYHNISLFGPGIFRLRDATGSALKLYTIHEYWLVCPTHVLWKLNRRACDAPQCLRCTLTARRPPQLWRYTDLLERCAAEVDVFLAPSRFTAEIHARRGFSQPTVQFPLFVEPSDANGRRASRSPHPRPYFLFVGRLEAVKGVRSLIEAWNGRSEDLLIAGAGSEGKQLRALAADNPRIRFLGHQPPQQLSALYDHCLACIVPSLMIETFPTVMLEAFARKAPVIARDQDPLSEMIHESRGGVLYRTQGELADALTRLARSPSLRVDLGENGYRMVTKRWSRDAHREAYFGLLRDAALRKLGHVPWESAMSAASTQVG